MRQFLLTLFAVLVILGISCESPISITCTNVGCESGLTVIVSGGPTDTPVTVVATAAGVQSVPVTCEDPARGCQISLKDWFPTTVTIEVSFGDTSHSFTASPSYEIIEPNGPDCPPTCEVAQVDIDLSDVVLTAG